MFPHADIKSAELLAAESKAKPYKMPLGGGLYLFVSPHGGKYWRLKYRFDGKEKTFSIGVFPQISLLDALKARDKAKALLKDGIDPSAHKKQETLLRKNEKKQKILFRIEATARGGLVIANEFTSLNLNQAQLGALRSFLAALPEEGAKL